MTCEECGEALPAGGSRHHVKTTKAEMFFHTREHPGPIGGRCHDAALEAYRRLGASITYVYEDKTKRKTKGAL